MGQVIEISIGVTELLLPSKSGFGFLNLLLLAKLLVSLQLSLGALLKSFGFPVYVSERVSILLAFHRIYSRVGFYSPKCSLGRPRPVLLHPISQPGAIFFKKSTVRQVQHFPRRLSLCWS